MKVGDLTTPALLVDAECLEQNLATMAAALPDDFQIPETDLDLD